MNTSVGYDSRGLALHLTLMARALKHASCQGGIYMWSKQWRKNKNGCVWWWPCCSSCCLKASYGSLHLKKCQPQHTYHARCIFDVCRLVNEWKNFSMSILQISVIQLCIECCGHFFGYAKTLVPSRLHNFLRWERNMCVLMSPHTAHASVTCSVDAWTPVAKKNKVAASHPCE